MILVWLLLAVCGGFGVWHYKRRGFILQIGVYFNLLAAMYMAFGLTLSWSTMGPGFTGDLQQIGWMSIAAVTGFNLAYWIAGIRQPGWSNREPGYLPSHTTMVFVVGGALCFEAAAILLTGPLEFLLSDRVERFAIVRPRQAMFYFANFINVCLPIVLARYFSLGLRRDRNLLYFIVAHGVIFGLMTISRYDLSIIVLSLCYFLERHRVIQPRLVLVILVFSLTLTLFFKPSLYRVLLGESYLTAIDLGEYNNWIRNTLLLMGRPEVELPHNGYLLTLKSLFVIRPQEDALAEWFFKEFFPDRRILFPGLGYGFSGVWEGYASNGLIGVAAHFAFFGACFGLLERSPSAMRQVFVVFTIVLMYRLFRSESYNFVKTFAWYFAYPAFAIVFLDRFMMWATRRSAIEAGHLPRHSGPESPCGADARS